jgi:hypothetical protein
MWHFSTQALLDKASPALSKVLNSEIANSIGGLKKLPGVMGFQETGEAITIKGGPTQNPNCYHPPGYQQAVAHMDLQGISVCSHLT